MRSPTIKNPNWPTCDQFRSFEDTYSYLKGDEVTCMWFLPTKKPSPRFCAISMSRTDRQQLLVLIQQITQLKALPPFQTLQAIAKQCCCARHHRDTVWGSGLAMEVAVRWLNDICTAKGLFLQEKITTVDIVKPIVFSKYQAHASESLLSTLRSGIPGRSPSKGSLYFYTYENEAFKDMIKIGYTSKAVRLRLKEWAKCGQGDPELLASVESVSYPERAETLTHFQLMDHRHRQGWCNNCRRPHIEWFKIELERAQTVAELWSRWLKEAHPYSVNRTLGEKWDSHIDFLVEHGNPITAEAMVLIHEIENGSEEIHDFIDDDALRKLGGPVIKKEED